MLLTVILSEISWQWLFEELFEIVLRNVADTVVQNVFQKIDVNDDCQEWLLTTVFWEDCLRMLLTVILSEISEKIDWK